MFYFWLSSSSCNFRKFIGIVGKPCVMCKGIYWYEHLGYKTKTEQTKDSNVMRFAHIKVFCPML